MIKMHWYWKQQGGHVHIRVFLGIPNFTFAKCGDLCFREKEFRQLVKQLQDQDLIELLPE